MIDIERLVKIIYITDLFGSFNGAFSLISCYKNHGAFFGIRLADKILGPSYHFYSINPRHSDIGNNEIKCFIFFCLEVSDQVQSSLAIFGNEDVSDPLLNKQPVLPGVHHQRSGHTYR